MLRLWHLMFWLLYLAVDGQLNAKICDLELGGIRDSHHRLSSDVTPTDLSAKGQGQRINSYATNMNITWQAPEVLSELLV